MNLVKSLIRYIKKLKPKYYIFITKFYIDFLRKTNDPTAEIDATKFNYLKTIDLQSADNYVTTKTN